MEHQGNKLKGIAKAQGFDIQRLADALEMHRVTVEKDFKDESLTRKRLKKYETLLGFNSDEFYIKPDKAVGASSIKQGDSLVIELYKKLLQEKDERIKLLESQVRFFPNAAQMV